MDSIVTKAGLFGLALILLAAALMPALGTKSSEAAGIPAPHSYQQHVEALSVDVGCVIRNAGYAINWIINSSPWWYHNSVIISWNNLRATRNPYWGAVFVGLVSPWAYAIVRPCIR